MKTATITQEMLSLINRFDNELKILLTHDLRSKKASEKIMQYMQQGKPALVRAV